MSSTLPSPSPDLNIPKNGSHRCKVQIWLDHQPPFLLSPMTTPLSQRHSPATITTPPKDSKKRKSLPAGNAHVVGPIESAFSTKKRKVLHSRDMNSVQEPTKHENKQLRRQCLTRSQKEGQDAIPRRTSPRKHNKSIAERLESAVQNDPILLSKPNLLEGPCDTAALSPNSYATDLENASLNILSASPPLSTQSRSSAPSRPPSPVKTIGDLHLAEPPIHFSEDYGALAECPDVAKTLWCEVTDAAHGASSIPGFLKVCPLCSRRLPLSVELHRMKLTSTYRSKEAQRSLNSSLSDRDWRKRSNNLSVGNGRKFRGYVKGRSLVSRPTIPRLAGARKSSAESWKLPCNTRAFWTGLNGATCEQSRYSEVLKLMMGRTSARIAPNSLRPTDSSGNLFQSKMVDYAITLLPDEKFRQQIRLSLRDFPTEHRNVNQTPFSPVKFRPISLNIEAKTPGSGKYDMMVQLSIWVAAQFKKLEMLRGAKSVDIGLPLVSIEGHDWKAHMAYQVEDGSIVSVALFMIKF